MTPTLECPKCGQWFEQDQSWKKICFDCWRAAKEEKESRNFDQLKELAQQHFETAVQRLQAEHDRLTGVGSQGGLL